MSGLPKEAVEKATEAMFYSFYPTRKWEGTSKNNYNAWTAAAEVAIKTFIDNLE